MPSDAVPLSELSAALDEIYRLRSLLAYEADVLAVHADYSRFPKSRKGVVAASLGRMRLAARGGSGAAIAGISWRSLAASRLMAGAAESLTVQSWREEQANAK